MFHLTANGHQDTPSDVPSEENDTVYNVPLNSISSHDNSSVSVGQIYYSVHDTTELESLEALPPGTPTEEAEAAGTVVNTVQQNEEASAPQTGFAWKVNTEAVAAQVKTGAHQDLEGYDMVEDLMGDKADASQAMKVTLEDWPKQGIEQHKTQRIDGPEKTAIQ